MNTPAEVHKLKFNETSGKHSNFNNKNVEASKWRDIEGNNVNSEIYKMILNLNRCYLLKKLNDKRETITRDETGNEKVKKNGTLENDQCGKIKEGEISINDVIRKQMLRENRMFGEKTKANNNIKQQDKINNKLEEKCSTGKDANSGDRGDVLSKNENLDFDTCAAVKEISGNKDSDKKQCDLCKETVDTTNGIFYNNNKSFACDRCTEKPHKDKFSTSECQTEVIIKLPSLSLVVPQNRQINKKNLNTDVINTDQVKKYEKSSEEIILLEDYPSSSPIASFIRRSFSLFKGYYINQEPRNQKVNQRLPNYRERRGQKVIQKIPVPRGFGKQKVNHRLPVRVVQIKKQKTSHLGFASLQMKKPRKSYRGFPDKIVKIEIINDKIRRNDLPPRKVSRRLALNYKKIFRMCKNELKSYTPKISTKLITFRPVSQQIQTNNEKNNRVTYSEQDIQDIFMGFLEGTNDKQYAMKDEKRPTRYKQVKKVTKCVGPRFCGGNCPFCLKQTRNKVRMKAKGLNPWYSVYMSRTTHKRK